MLFCFHKIDRASECKWTKIALKSFHGKYVVAEKSGKANANRNHARSWETFTVEDLGKNKIALKSVHGKYLVAEKSNKDVNANRSKRGPWEVFQVEKQRDGTIALKTSHGFYVVAEKDGRLRADRKKIGNWEKFTFECKKKSKLLNGINYYIMFIISSPSLY